MKALVNVSFNLNGKHLEKGTVIDIKEETFYFYQAYLSRVSNNIPVTVITVDK